jgi:hypothetical protein
MDWAHCVRTSARRSRSVKCRHVRRAPIWTSDRLFVKMRETAAAISMASGAVAADSCQRRLSNGVIEVLGSSSLFVDMVKIDMPLRREDGSSQPVGKVNGHGAACAPGQGQLLLATAVTGSCTAKGVRRGWRWLSESRRPMLPAPLRSRDDPTRPSAAWRRIAKIAEQSRRAQSHDGPERHLCPALQQPHIARPRQMGKKRTHAETKDGPARPPPDKSRLSAKHDGKDARANGQAKPRANLVSGVACAATMAHTADAPCQVFTPQPEWHAIAAQPTVPARHVLEALHQYADELLIADGDEYSASHLAKDSSHKFMSTVMTSGTMEDKVSALTLLIQESPLHTTKAFEQLLGLSRKKSRSSAMMALAALKDLMGQGVVLPPDRKLKAFARQPGLISAMQGKAAAWKYGDRLPGAVQKAHLVAWAYEDWLKKQYFEMLKIIEGWSNDEVEFSRNRAVTMVWELLKEKPEQEENLLRLLINKLGDKEKKVASRASYLLLQLQITHPAMKSVIISSIESDLLFRPNQSGTAKYYGVITMNQTVLSGREQDVANKLLEIYFSLFVGLLRQQKGHDEKEQAVEKLKVNKHGLVQGGGGKPGKAAQKKAEKAATQAFKVDDENREKLISAILTGVNRAFPFAKTDDEK